MTVLCDSNSTKYTIWRHWSSVLNLAFALNSHACDLLEFLFFCKSGSSFEDFFKIIFNGKIIFFLTLEKQKVLEFRKSYSG